MIAFLIAALLLGILTLPPPLAWACLLGIGVQVQCGEVVGRILIEATA